MALEGDVSITGLARTEEDPNLADAADISGGVSTTFEQASASITLFLDVAGAVDLTVELSPDSGQSWYTPEDSSLPISFTEANEDVVKITYPATGIRITASDTTAVTAEVLATA